ncbi:MAG: hypothetical protein AMJ46_14025 [Latescibacteria bacterium DG_63]|nr:MAG: hypothetical protein AMJ46_14025 [Latescibacteria bacterium DG_63]
MTTLEEVLVRMGFVTQEDVDKIKDFITMSTREEMFGKLLVAHDLISDSQLEEASKLLSELQSSDSEIRAAAASEYVGQRTAKIVNLAACVQSKASRANTLSSSRKRESTGTFPAVVMAKPE